MPTKMKARMAIWENVNFNINSTKQKSGTLSIIHMYQTIQA